MGVFSFKKKETESRCCNENVHSNETTNTRDSNFSIKILGSGCAKCNQLEKNTVEALKQLNVNTKIEHVTDFSKIASYGVMSTPAIVFNEKVISYGKVLKPDEIVTLLEKAGI